MKKKVYICAPLGGNVQQNLERAIRFATYALRSGVAPVVPHFYALCLDDADPKQREIGMSAELSLLWFCDEMWVFGEEITDGMREEIRFCQNMKIKTKRIREKEIKKIIGGGESR